MKLEDKKLYKPSLKKLAWIEEVIAEHAALGIANLTVRQIHYQLVGKGYIPNTDYQYGRLGDLIRDARRRGYLDWDIIVDITRYSRKLLTWKDDKARISSAVKNFRIDKWGEQEYRPRIWVEKDAVINTIYNLCEELEVPYLSLRGNTSDSQLYQAKDDILWDNIYECKPVIIHLADHDYAGLDMTRDIEERLELFRVEEYKYKRIALNYAQVEAYNPPPNFREEKPKTKEDPRYIAYKEQFGDASWELDALGPAVLNDLIRKAVESYRDEEAWSKALEQEEEYKAELESLENNYEAVKEFLASLNGKKP